MTQLVIDKLLSEPTFSNDAAGKLQKVQYALWELENVIGKKAWLTMIINVIDFERHRITRDDITFPAVDKAVRSFKRAGGM